MTCTNITSGNILNLQCIIINEVFGSALLFTLIAFLLIIWFCVSRRMNYMTTIAALVLFVMAFSAFIPSYRMIGAIIFIVAVIAYLGINRFINRG